MRIGVMGLVRALCRPVVVPVLTALVLGVGFAPAAFAERRVALVVGNGAYQHTQPLANPANDAKAIATTLRNLGFDVIQALDLDQQSFLQTLSRFTGKLDGAETALLYYAGHGVQFDGANYLLPVDARLEDSFALAGTAVPLNDILDLMEGYAATNILLLDACRNNPFVNQLGASDDAQRSRKGLARLEADGSDTLIMYATSPDSVAEDGELGNSPFAQAFVRHAPTVGAELTQVARSVIRDVRQQTNYRQSPEVMSAMGRSFYFAGRGDGDQAALMAADYDAARVRNSIAGWSSFLETYPEGFFSTLAREQLNALQAQQTNFDPYADFAQTEKQLGLSEGEVSGMLTTLAALAALLVSSVSWRWPR